MAAAAVMAAASATNKVLARNNVLSDMLQAEPLAVHTSVLPVSFKVHKICEPLGCEDIFLLA